MADKVKERAICAIYDFKVKAVRDAINELWIFGLHIVYVHICVSSDTKFLILSHCYILAIIIICVVSSPHLTVFKEKYVVNYKPFEKKMLPLFLSAIIRCVCVRSSYTITN